MLGYKRALKLSTAAAILAGAQRYRDDPNREEGFTAHPTTWLNRAGWDDPPIPSRVSARPADPPRPMTSGEMDRYIEEAVWRE
jgi:hypothetical protein